MDANWWLAGDRAKNDHDRTRRPRFVDNWSATQLQVDQSLVSQSAVIITDRSAVPDK